MSHDHERRSEVQGNLETHNPTNGKEALVLVILWFIGYISVAAIADTPLTTHSQTLPELVRSLVTTSQSEMPCKVLL